MTTYGVSTLLLIDMLEDQSLTHKWYADDGNVASSLESLQIVLDKLYECGGLFSHNVIKCHLIAKPEVVQEAKKVFSGLGVDNIESHRVLGSVNGSDEKCNDFLKEKSMNYSNMLQKLAKHSKVSPQNVYKSFTNGLQLKLTFIAKTTPNADSLLRKTENIIDKYFLPSMFNHLSFIDKYWNVFSLPFKEGGLSILLPEDRQTKTKDLFEIVSPYRVIKQYMQSFIREKFFRKPEKKNRNKLKR